MANEKFTYKPLNAKAYAALVQKIAGTGAQFVLDVQQAAVEAVRFSIVDRNATPAIQLYEAMPKGASRRDSLVTYLEVHGNIMWSKEKQAPAFFDVGAHMPERGALKWDNDYARKCASTPWQEAKPEPKIKSVYDVQEALDALLKRAASQAKKGVKIEHGDLLAKLKAASAQYAAEAYKHDDEVDAEEATRLLTGVGAVPAVGNAMRAALAANGAANQ